MRNALAGRRRRLMPKKAAASSTPSLGTSVPAPVTQINLKEFQLIDDQKLAELFDIDPRTPAQWRYQGRFKKELPVIRIGRCCRYRLGDALALINSQTNQTHPIG